jgi:hypothetical protein
MHSRRSALLVAGALALMPLVAAGPASALKPPVPEMQEVLIKASLMSFNDANVTGNYAVLHGKLSKPFRDQFTPEKLAQTFKPFADAHVDFAVVVAKPPVATDAVQIDDDGRLVLRGYFDTQPSRVHYDLAFILSEGEWKLIKLNVNVKKADE